MPTLFPFRRATPGSASSPRPNLRLEAAMFFLLVVTFVLVLGRESLTTTRWSIQDAGAAFLPYGYSDAATGGHSVSRFDPKAPLTWECTLRPGATDPFCGHGLRYAAAPVDLSGFDKVIVRLAYRGTPGRLKLTLKNFDPAYSRPDQSDSSMPVSVEFDVHPGENLLTLPLSRFTVDSWWLARHPLPPGTRMPDLRHIVAIDFVTAGPAAATRFRAAIEALQFEGIFVTPAEWYLLLIALWTAVAAGMLVHRFLAVRRIYEAEQQAQARAARALAEAHVAAEAASAAKSEFLANMSHELRTPLNAILGYAQLLEREELAPRHRQAARTIHQSGTHLLTLITDILDLSKIEAGKLEILTAPIDLAGCIDQVAAMIRLRAEEKGLAFTATVAADVPTHVIGDEKRIRQVLLNLLGNAVKFTASGEVRLEVSVAGWGEGQVRLRLDVIDSGSGIPADQIDRIFLPFEQAGGARQRGGGTGLGLGIARQLVSAMGGALTVESVEGEGSRFRAEIQCGLGVRQQLEGPLPAAPRLPGVHALVVEDDPASAAMLQTYLEGRGLVVTRVGDGLAAVNAARLAWPRLILMDLKLPVMGGADAIRRLKADPVLRDVPVVATSGMTGPAAEAEVLAAGAVQLLAKPIDLDALGACLAQLFAVPATTPPPLKDDALVAPPAEALETLLALARAGNMRAIRREAAAIAERDPAHTAFAEHLAALAAAYQSPKVLRLIESKRIRIDAT
ncbi:ATP-binding protein [Sphingomonas azotifigens]|uniref:ATP-binding protein n=1 Tax=Sphingomonas azotifigens TaxID=330920 RepID=UPI001FEB09CB|nr:ATP-binding protein [Sphingomonas azotifigens]